MDVFSQLKAPFRDDQIRYRVGATNAKKVQRQSGNNSAKATKGLALAYIDGRDVCDRLDSVTGGLWQCEHFDAGNGRLSCKIGILIDEQWIWKSDGAGGREASRGLSEHDSNKGDFSDALKRAAMVWGVGRYLYDMKNQWVSIDKWGQITDEMRPILDRNHAMLARGKIPPAIAVNEPAPPKRMSKTDDARQLFTRMKTAISELKNMPDLEKFKRNKHVASALSDLPEDWARDMQAELSNQEHLLSMAAADEHEKQNNEEAA